MTENASLSDYLVELRRDAPRERLLIAIGLGAASAATGALLGPSYAGLAGLGCAVVGVSAWALLNQLADSVDDKFDTKVPFRVRHLRSAGIVALILAAVGTLLALTSFFFHFVMVTTGM